MGHEQEYQHFKVWAEAIGVVSLGLMDKGRGRYVGEAKFQSGFERKLVTQAVSFQHFCQVFADTLLADAQMVARNKRSGNWTPFMDSCGLDDEEREELKRLAEAYPVLNKVLLQASYYYNHH